MIEANNNKTDCVNSYKAGYYLTFVKKDLVDWKIYCIFTKIALPINCESSINGVSLTGHKFGSQ